MKEIVRKYRLDKTGESPVNRVVGEPHTLKPGINRSVVTRHGAFFTDTLIVRDADTGRELNIKSQYIPVLHYPEASKLADSEICCGVVITDPEIGDRVIVDYQVLGGVYCNIEPVIANLINNINLDEREVLWGDVFGRPSVFPPVQHLHDIGDIYGWEYVVQVLNDMTDLVLRKDVTSHIEIEAFIEREYGSMDAYADSVLMRIREHKARRDNPHNVTKSQVGLGNVANYAKSTTDEAYDEFNNNTRLTPSKVMDILNEFILRDLDKHLNDRNNPHQVTKAQVGLGKVLNLLVATIEEAIEGTRDDRYVTPDLARRAIADQGGAILQAHLEDFTNPHNVTKHQVGLGLLKNFAMASIQQAKDGSRNDLYLSPRTAKEAIDQAAGDEIANHVARKDNPHKVTKAQVGLGKVPNMSIAQLDKRFALSGSNYLTTLDGPLTVSRGKPYEWQITNYDSYSDYSVDAPFLTMNLGGKGASWQEILNSWTRFSRKGDTLTTTFDETEMNAWQYNTDTNSVECTINSTTYIGFISPESYQNYVFEARVSSANGDDDYIGIVLAYARDASGQVHTLEAVRRFNTSGQFRIHKNFAIGVDSKELHRYQGILKWPDGSVGSKPTSSNDPNNGWDDVPNGVRIKATRVGDTITVETTQTNTSDYIPDAAFTIDLNDDPDLHVFRGAQQIGFGCLSQALATWDVLQFPIGDDIVPGVVKSDWATGPSKMTVYRNGEPSVLEVEIV
ncbi:MAG: hypothetical protein CL582_11875 [Alteromonadaceae bacterium]|nr:hypothetical protein [Alteromonadaceae bacterium]